MVRGARSEERGASTWDVERVRKDFPILTTKAHEKPLVYLDNAATSQKPWPVIKALHDFYETSNANVHRGVHWLSEKATALYEGTREKVRAYFNANSTKEIIYTHGTTEGINLVANSYGASLVAGDEIIISELEHHSNIVPWQMLCERTGARLRVAPIDDDGQLLFDAFEQLLTDRTRIVAMAHVSNSLGSVLPVREVIQKAHAAGAVVMLDGAQRAPHHRIDVQALGCDFYVCSGHKMYGPTGAGILYGRQELLDRMPPWMGGGDMIESVSFERTTYAGLPARFEAGTPDIAAVAGLSAALDYMSCLDFDALNAHEHSLMVEASERLAEIPGVRLIGTAKEKAAVVSFVVEGVHAHDVASVLDFNGVAVRAGHHCTQPLMRRMGVTATARASFAMYNTHQEVDALIAGLHDVKRVFSS
ncbi:MAG TPA: cysteine desulfurase [Gemmatimonadaceae bacterium]|nr:cysteine desulfurase [Gemmatimonadaceae bacterium]